MATHVIDRMNVFGAAPPPAIVRSAPPASDWDVVAASAATLAGATSAAILVARDADCRPAPIGVWPAAGERPGSELEGQDHDDDRRLTLALSTSNGRRAWLVLDFADPPARRDASDRIAPIVALIERALAIEARATAVEAQHHAAAAALDQDRCAVIAVTADARPLLINSEAAAMLAAGDRVHIAHGTIRPTHYPDILRFHAALDAVVRHADQRHRARGDAVILSLRGKGRAVPLVVTITPVAPTTGDRSDKAAAIIRLFRPVVSTHGIDAVCQLFGLSPVEARLAEHLYRGQTIAEAATALHIKVETARSYLKQVFAKTDTHRQADLIALFSQYCFTVRGNYDYVSL
jgi:DNA-binding CsgD family transcriptional regulator/PAS domain-containing protein